MRSSIAARAPLSWPVFGCVVVLGLGASARAEVSRTEARRGDAVGGVVASSSAAPSTEASSGTPAASSLRFLPALALEQGERLIQSGVRVERTVRGQLLVAQARFESGGDPTGIELPAHLGGGFLFVHPTAAPGIPATALYRSDTWTSPLRPLGTVPFAVMDVRAGFDRLFLLGSGLHVGLDPDRGTYLPLAPLPPTITLQGLDFPEPGVARVVAPVVGMQVSRDAGLTWQVEAETLQGGPTRLDVGGQERPSGGGPEGPTPLSQAVLRGVPFGERIALLSRGRLLLIRADAVLEADDPVPGLAAEATCQGYSFEKPQRRAGRTLAGSFVCQGRSTSVFSLELDVGAVPLAVAASVRLLASFAGPRRPLAVGQAGTLLAGSCSTPSDAGLCLVTERGREDLPSPRGRERGSFAVGAGDVVRVHRRPGTKRIVIDSLRKGGAKKEFELEEEREIEDILLRGTWLPGARLHRGDVTLWATSGDRFVGVEFPFADDARGVRVGPIQKPLRRAFISGHRALTWGAAGFTRMTTDGGLTWREVTFPFRSGDPDPNAVVSDTRELWLGCGPGGCSLSTWLSFGWGAEPEGVVAELPPLVPIPPPGGGRYAFDCTDTGRKRPSRVSLAGSPPAAPSFWDFTAPRLPPGEEGFSVMDHAALARVLVWGPREVTWGRRGNTRALFRSPFELSAPRSSAPTPGLFPDAPRAQEALGLLDASSQVVSTEVDLLGRGGVMLVRTRQGATLLAFSEGGAVVRFDVEESLLVRNLAGVVMRSGSWYFGNVLGHRFRLFELSTSGLRLALDLRLGESGARDLQLTQSTSGALGIFAIGDAGLFVYPVSPRGELGDVVFAPHQGSRPPRCAPEAAGYYAVHRLGIAPYVEAGGRALDLDEIRLRLILGYGSACVDVASAETREPLGPLPRGPLPRGQGRARDGTDAQQGASGVPLIVSDHSDGGARVELSCL